MAFLDNNPTFTYVKCSNLSIIYNNMSYEIQNTYTNCKYLYWDLKTPNVLIETNIRPTESSSKFLVCINDKGIHTEVPHDELIYNFGVYSPGEISQGEFNSLKVKVDENTEKYNTISRTVDGVTEIIGKEEVLEDGSIIKNLNTVKKTASDLTVKVEEMRIEYADDFKDIRNKVSDKLVSLLTSISTMHSDFSSYSNDGKLESVEKTQLTTDMSAINSSLADLTIIVTELITLLGDNNQDNYVNKLTLSLENVKTSVNALVSLATTSISDDTISSSDVTTVTQSVGEASKYVNLLKVDCDEIMLLGLGGTIYDQFAQLKLLNDRFQTTVKEIKYSTSNSLSSERSKAYAQIEDLISVTDAFYNLIKSLGTTSNLSTVEINAINSAISKITTEYTELMTLGNVYETSTLLSDIEKQEFVNKGVVLTNKYNELLTSVNSMLTDSYMNSSEKNTILNNIKLLLDSIGVYNNDLSEVILLIESYKFTSKINAAKEELNNSISDLNDSLDGLVNVTNETFKNNLIDKTEAQNLKNSLSKLQKEKNDVVAIYNSIKLLANDTTVFTKYYNSLNSEYTLLITMMQKYTNTSTIPTEADKTKINTGYKNISKKLENFIKEGYEVNKCGALELYSSTYDSYTTSKFNLLNSLATFNDDSMTMFNDYYLTSDEKDKINTLYAYSQDSVYEYLSQINDYVRDVFISESTDDETLNLYTSNYNDLSEENYLWKDVCEYVINKNFIISEYEIDNIVIGKNTVENKLTKFQALVFTLCSKITRDFINVYDILVSIYNNLYGLNSETGIISEDVDTDLIATLSMSEIENNYTNFISVKTTALVDLHTEYSTKYTEITTAINNIVSNAEGYDLNSCEVLILELLKITHNYINTITNYIYNSELDNTQLNAWINDLYALHTGGTETYDVLTNLNLLYSNAITSFDIITTTDVSEVATIFPSIDINPIIWFNSKALSGISTITSDILALSTNYTTLNNNINSIYKLYGSTTSTTLTEIFGKYNQLISELDTLIAGETDEITINNYTLKKEEYELKLEEIKTEKDDYNESIINIKTLLDDFLTIINNTYVEGTFLSEEIYVNQNINKTNFTKNISDLSNIVENMIYSISKHVEYLNKSLLEIETDTMKSSLNLTQINMEDIFIDNYLTESEKVLITQNLQNVETQKLNLESSYLSLLENKYIVDENKKNLVATYEYYCIQYLNVIDVINSFLTKSTMMTSSDSQALKEAMSDYNTAMSNFNVAKDKAISAAYKNEAEKYSEKSIESNFTQMSNSFNFIFDNIEKKVTSKNDKLIETLNKFQTYVKIIQGDDNKPHVILGKTGNTTDSQFKIDISNEKMSFLQNDKEVAYVQYDNFMIANGKILDSLQIGAFTFMPNSDGGVRFKYKGVD